MVKDEDLCVHCGLCAERCPTAAWDMQKFDLHQPYAGRPVPPGRWPAPASATIAAPPGPPANAAARNPTFPLPSGRRPVSPPESPQDLPRCINSRSPHQRFALKLANVNGTGSQVPTACLMQAIFTDGIPVSGKNLFPSTSGPATWYEIRVNKDGHTGAGIEYDLMVAMNVETYARDVAPEGEVGRLAGCHDSAGRCQGAHPPTTVLYLGRAAGPPVQPRRSPSRASAS
jgi:ferredoxin